MTRNASTNPRRGTRSPATWLRRPLALVAIALLSASALAVQPGRWAHTTEADYAGGKSEHLVVTNLGDIKLSVRSEEVGDLSEQASIINAVQRAGNGDVYLAAGPDGAKILRQHDKKIDEVIALPGEQVFSLALIGNDRLIVGVSGEHCRIAELRGGKLETLIELPEVQYIWDMLADARQVVIATGSEGKVLMIDLAKAAEARAAAAKAGATRPAATAASAPATRKAKASAADKKSDKHGKAGGKGAGDHAESRPAGGGNPAIKELLASGQTNVLCLARDKQGRIYAGTDDDGLIFRITLKDGADPEAMVIYDAPEPEIGALLVTADGTVYAGTADAEQARPGRLGEAASTEAGRPEPTAAAKQAPAGPASPPEPPSPPVQPKPAPANPPAATAPAKSSSLAPHHSPLALRPRATPTLALAARTDARLAIARLADEDDAEESPVRGPSASDGDDKADAAPATDNPKVTVLGFEQDHEGIDMAPPRPPRGPRPGMRPGMPPGMKPPTPRPPGSPGAKEGNAIYRITPDGFVNEVFRESVMILRLIEDPTPAPGAAAGVRLLVATGNEGKLFRVDPSAGETTILDDLDAQQIATLLANPDGSVLAGTANPASLIRLVPGFANQGTFTSAPMDAGHISRWGHLALTANIPKGATLSLETRSGNVQDPDQAAWAAWSKPRVLDHDPKADALAPIRLDNLSPPARFLQYRLTLKSDGKATPVVDRVELAYVTPNLKPMVNSVQVNSASALPTGGGAPPGKPAMPGMPRMARPPMPGGSAGAGAPGDEPEPQTSITIEWDASDPNSDRLKYTLEYQPAGTTKWLPLAKDVDQPTHEWQTRRVPDGRYIVRVTATDAADNTPETAMTATRQSDPVTIDNTPPAIDKVKAALNKNTLTLTGAVSDALSTIKSIHYALDSTEAFKPVQTDDGIADSTAETFTATLTGLSPGPHVITLRAVDSHHNARYKNVLIEVADK